MSKRSLITLVVILLSACEVGPDYHRPITSTPDLYKEAGDWQRAAPLDTIDRGAWWSVYNDPILDGLEKQIDISNQNLKSYEAAYREAVALADQARSNLFPTVTAGASATRQGTGGASGRGGSSTSSASTLTTNTGTNSGVSTITTASGPTAYNSYNLSATGSWDIDLWGGIRRNLESSEATAATSAANLAGARLSAQAQLATDYFDLRAQDELQRILNEAVEDDKRTLLITQNQYKVGVAAEADVLTAQTQLEGAQSAAINVGIQRAVLEHAIAVLIGQPPAVFVLLPVTGVGLIPNIPADMPSTLLERRPDIASAERSVIAANAQIGVATAAWFPDLTLSASYGTAALVIGKLLQASSTVWSFGPSVAETIFDAGRREAVVDQARATYDQTVATYRQTVLSAFQQVEDELASLRILADQAKVQDAVVVDARKAEQLTLNQYKEGIVPYSSVLAAQVTRLTDEQNDLSVLTFRLQDSVALIEALGGGWDASQLPK